MAVKLRLMRMGKKKQPTYRVVAADSRSPRNGRFIEIIGTYEPRQDPSVIKIDNERAVHWLANGAQPTDRVEKLLKISGAWTEHTGEAFDALNAAMAPEAYLLTVASGVRVDQPLLLELAQGAPGSFLRIAVRLGEGSSLTLIERQSGDDHAFFSIMCNLTLEAGA
ncbi:MAG: 30S ribosomal protein S16, partial [Actinobacteria bacterium]|nr:30S ribosomal protein S16 [Actinomycetota bacterium]